MGIVSAPFLEDWSSDPPAPLALLRAEIVLKISALRRVLKGGTGSLDWSRKNSEIKPPLYFKNQDTLTGHDLSSFTKYRIYYETKLPVLILNQQSETAVLIYEPFQTLFNEFTNSPIKKF